jgi:hypothetical protein
VTTPQGKEQREWRGKMEVAYRAVEIARLYATSLADDRLS